MQRLTGRETATEKETAPAPTTQPATAHRDRNRESRDSRDRYSVCMYAYIHAGNIHIHTCTQPLF